MFENVQGYKTPVLTNVLSTEKKMAVALGVEGDMKMMFEKFLSGFNETVQPVEVKGGSLQGGHPHGGGSQFGGVSYTGLA